MMKLSPLCAIAVLAIASPAVSAAEVVAADAGPDANVGATPERDDRLFQAFGGKPGIDRIVTRFIDRNVADPRVADIFRSIDKAHSARLIAEQICHILRGGCVYSGKSMASAHRDMGLQTRDFNAVVENLQWAMRREGVSFANQNRLLAKLSPMRRHIVER